jgi:hypothetical protein
MYLWVEEDMVMYLSEIRLCCKIFNGMTTHWVAVIFTKWLTMNRPYASVEKTGMRMGGVSENAVRPMPSSKQNGLMRPRSTSCYGSYPISEDQDQRVKGKGKI